jgi:hypothetical protein
LGRIWTRRFIGLAILFAIALVIGKIVQSFSDTGWIDQVQKDQEGLIDALQKTSPIGVATTFWTELTGAFTGDPSNGSQAAMLGKGLGLFSPIVALYFTVMRLFTEGGWLIVGQIALGALAVAVSNFSGSNGKRIFFEEFVTNVLWGPFAVVFAASVIGLGLWAVMWVAFHVLGWISVFAAIAAGGIVTVGFCWLCFSVLGRSSNPTDIISPGGGLTL